jgi:integrase
MKITKTFIKGLAKPDREQWHWDDQTPGFGLRVWPSGKAVFVLRYRTAAGTQRKLTIGDARIMDPDEARDRARKAMVEVRDGNDPQKDRAVVRKAETIEELCREYMEVQKAHLKPSSYEQAEILNRVHIVPQFGKVKVVELRAEEVERWHRQFTGRGKYAANHAVHQLSHALTWARDVKGWITKNPLTGFRYYRPERRQHILTPQEMRALLAELDRGSNRLWSSRFLFKLLLLTGLRLREWSMAEWSQYNDVMGTLTLPPERTKTGYRVVQLGDEVRIILRQMKSHPKAHERWIFPNEKGTGPTLRCSSVWKLVKKNAGLGNVRLHDLRHTFASYSLLSGANIKEVQRMLGHSSIKSTDRYVGVFDDTIQAAQDVAAKTIRNIAITGHLPTRAAASHALTVAK